jgi:hypothetical protein
VQVEPALALFVVVRWRPVRTAVNGRLVARRVRTTMAHTWRRWLPTCPGGEARPSVTHRLVGKSPQGSRQ